MSAERVERLRAALREVYESGASVAVIENRAHAALRADDEAARQETPDPSAREAARGTCTRPPEGWACTLDEGHDGPCPTIPNPEDVRRLAEEWLASVEGGFPGTRPWEHQVVLRSLFAQPRPVQDAIRDLLSGGDQ